MRALTPVCLATMAVLTLTGCGSASSAHTAAQVRHDPLLGEGFYVDPSSPARQEVAQLRSEGDAQQAAAVQRIAAQPSGTWFTAGSGVEAGVRKLSLRAAAARRNLLLVAYYIPGRDCGGYSSGGAPSPSAYRAWIDRFAAGIGPRRATVILEPDAIAQALSGCLGRQETVERYALLSYATARLKADGHVSVYLDAGNPGWIQPPVKLAAPLRRSGIAQADGFALNVSNFYATAETVRYGAALSKALGGSHFIVDTSRNGNGPYGAAHNGTDWCNPPGRALGSAPSTETSSPLVDAYLWVKPPGTSDGSCRPGEPRAGNWWPQYALELAGGS